MSTRKYQGELEVDAARGVIYFHSGIGITLLRICQLPPMPEEPCWIDITHMHGVAYSPLPDFLDNEELKGKE